jgi:hypothetical protein
VAGRKLKWNGPTQAKSELERATIVASDEKDERIQIIAQIVVYQVHQRGFCAIEPHIKVAEFI